MVCFVARTRPHEVCKMSIDPSDQLTLEERKVLLSLAREALEFGVRGEPIPPLNLEDLPQRLREPGATFVTLTKGGNLRGCIGTLEPFQPLAEDAREHAVAAALNDYRFPPVEPDELPLISIEISRLTVPKLLTYDGPEDLIAQLRPGVDGVVLQDGFKRATFLPQVWDKVGDVEEFLGLLCQKMGARTDLWKQRDLNVLTYGVEKLTE
jgi:AmmeMemoRadiSam system protein A